MESISTGLRPTTSLLDKIRPGLASFGVLSDPNYRLYIVLQVISLAGSMLASVVQGWVMASLSHSAFQVGIIWACSVGPLALLSPFIGHHIDGIDKRKILMTTSVLAAIQSCILGYVLDHVSYTVVGIDVLALCLGLINAVDGVARQAIIPDTLKDESSVGIASSLFTCLYTIGQALGPLVGVLLMLMFHKKYGEVFYANAASYIPLIIGLRLIKLTHHKEKDEEKTSFGAGVLYVWNHKKILTLIILSGIVSIFSFSPMMLLSVASMEMFHAKDAGICNWLSSSLGLGSGFGAMTVFLFSKNMPFRKFVTRGPVISGIALIGFAFTRTLLPGIILIFISGGGAITAFSCLRSTIMRLSHLSNPRKNGVVMSFTMSLMGIGLLIGFFGGGTLAKLAGCPATFVLFGISLLLIGCGALKLHPDTGNQ